MVDGRAARRARARGASWCSTRRPARSPPRQREGRRRRRGARPPPRPRPRPTPSARATPTTCATRRARGVFRRRALVAVVTRVPDGRVTALNEGAAALLGSAGRARGPALESPSTATRCARRRPGSSTRPWARRRGSAIVCCRGRRRQLRLDVVLRRRPRARPRHPPRRATTGRRARGLRRRRRTSPRPRRRAAEGRVHRRGEPRARTPLHVDPRRGGPAAGRRWAPDAASFVSSPPSSAASSSACRRPARPGLPPRGLDAASSARPHRARRRAHGPTPPT